MSQEVDPDTRAELEIKTQKGIAEFRKRFEEWKSKTDAQQIKVDINQQNTGR